MTRPNRRNWFLAFVFCTLPILLLWPNMARAQIAIFKTLDKVTGKTALLELEVLQPVRLGSLTVTLRSCRSTPPEEPPETTAFVEIDDTRLQVTERIFTGWMFASSPGLNALEHPVYDLWPINCKTETGELFTGKKEQEEAKPPATQGAVQGAEQP